MNNLFTGADARARSTIAALKSFEGEETFSGDTAILEDCFISLDPKAEIEGSFRATKSNSISIKMTPKGLVQPRWQALNFRLGKFDIDAELLLGIVIKTQSPKSVISHICIRSYVGDGFYDVFFDKTVVSYSEPSVHIDFIETHKKADILNAADWRDLIVFFRPGELDIDILDFRFFAT